MSVANLDLNFLPEESNTGRRTDGYDYVGSLWTDNKIISQIAVRHLPISLPPKIHFTQYEQASCCPLSNLPTFEFLPYHLAPPDRLQEWQKFLKFLHHRDKVVLIQVNGWELILKPPDAPPDERTPLRVCYRKLSTNRAQAQQMSPIVRPPVGHVMLRPRAEVLDPPLGGYEGPRINISSGFVPISPTSFVQPRVGLMHPSYLRTLAQTHASWLFGGLAELIDNARDALASRLNIAITMVKMKGKQEIIPMLRVEDNGKGMTHEDIVRMLSFGHSTPTDDNKDHIGHFGVGFKTGSMRIGKDVVVLTQNESSRSIGFLSSSYNADKQVLEVPIVTYRKVHGIMELDLRVQSEAEGEASLDAVKKHSPFSEFEIGSQFEKIGNGDTKNGTYIFIYNLEKWGSEYALQWDTEDSNSKQLKHRHKDITIRSKRVRTRPGQTSKEIPLDFSLRSYLEVLFLEPRMIIKIQGSKVKTQRLAVSLNTTERTKGKVLGKQVELTLGRSSVEYKRGNCGIFLYWHGRLIESFKRVGGMVHSADMGRGVIGVIDVTPLMETREGRIGVLNTKQGFEDSEEYAMLEKWLGEEFNNYWYRHFDNLVITTKVDGGPQLFEPDREWVQCDKCQKWRKLPRGVHTQDLPEEWFCYMEPFNGTCKEAEERADEDIVTTGVNRTSVPSPVVLPRESAPKVVNPEEANLEDEDVEVGHLSPVVPVVPARRHSTRKMDQLDGSSSQVFTSRGGGKIAPIKGDGRGASGESPRKKRRLKRPDVF